MIDRLFFAALTFCLLIGGTLAVGSELFEQRTAATAPVVRVVQLERVVVVGKRLAPAMRMAQRDATAEALLATRWQ